MSIKTQIIGKDSNRVAHLVKRNGDTGMLVFTKSASEPIISGRPFVNETFGVQMNQNIGFSGTPENINDGGDNAGWTGFANQGTWDFTDAGIGVSGGAGVSITNANNADLATFSDGTETDMSGRTAVTGQINLQTYSSTNNTILIQFLNNGVNVGNSINLNDFINTGIIGSYQSFIIPKTSLGISNQTVDQMELTITRSGGSRPTIFFDLMQIEETGNPAVFLVTPVPGTKFFLTELTINWADVGTGGTAYAFNKIGAISELANGINFTAVIDNVTIFSSVTTKLSDLLSAGGFVSTVVDDGTNTMISITISIANPLSVILDSRREDFMSFTINDDLSGLLQMTIFAGGYQEQI